MTILQFDEQEFENILDHSKEVGIDIDTNIESSYDSIVFLGSSLSIKEEEDLLEVAIFNIRLCYVYFKRKEEYEKLSALSKVCAFIESKDADKQIVDNDVINSININLN